MTSLALGPISLGTQPRIIGSLESAVPLNILKTLQQQGVTLLECRADLFTTPLEETLSYLDTIRALGGFGLLGTLRETPQNQNTRIQQFQTMLPHIDGIDIEIDTPIRDEVITLAQQTKKTVMVSFHDYAGTPSSKELQDLLNTGISAKADIVKIAVMAHSPEDVISLLNFTHLNNQHPLITIAMGPWGSLSRLASPLFGSLMSYGYITQSVAPGQLSVLELATAFKQHYPSFTH